MVRLVRIEGRSEGNGDGYRICFLTGPPSMQGSASGRNPNWSRLRFDSAKCYLHSVACRFWNVPVSRNEGSCRSRTRELPVLSEKKPWSFKLNCSPIKIACLSAVAVRPCENPVPHQPITRNKKISFFIICFC
jgi:hypothetical protein